MKNIQDLRKEEMEIRSLKGRFRVIFYPLLVLCLIGFFKIVQLTVLQQDSFEAESDKNRIVEIPIYPARGLFKLEDGTVIAENIVTQELHIKRSLLGISKLQIDLLKEKVFEETRKINLPNKNGNPEEFILLAGRLTDKEIARYELQKDSLPNVVIRAKLRRYLPHGNLFSHVIGHLGPVDKEDRVIFSDRQYSYDAYVGKVGLERAYEQELKGVSGKRVVEVDVFGNQVREIERISPKRPSDITVTLNLKLQQLAKEELNGRRGAVVALEPSTGKVKALVSSPDYNPNALNQSEQANPLTKEALEDAPFFNRAISGSYPPASTLKPFIGLLGLEAEVIQENTIIEDKGFFQLKEDGRKYRGWKEDGHGKVNLKKAIVESSDVYFYQLSSQLTIDRISDFLSMFGFGEITGIDLVTESKSILPNRNWKLGTMGETWFVGDTINIGIGQGYITSTPLQLAVSISALANKGKTYKPVLAVQNNFNPENFFEVSLREVQHWDVIEESMISVIESWNGTAHNLYSEDSISIAGKTGTAQIKSLMDQELTVSEEYEDVRQNVRDRDHALFASYGPIPEPNLVVVVIVENGESGSAVAAPIAKKLIEEYQNEQKNEQTNPS